MVDSIKVECPRCDSLEGEIIGKSPIPNMWSIQKCGRCNYLWRSTEDLEGIEKITADMIERAIEVRF